MRLIDADEAKRICEDEFDGVCVYDVSSDEATMDFERIIDRTPTVEYRAIGHWIRYGNNMCYCSECNQNYDEPRSDENYCGNCGAYMRGK